MSDDIHVRRATREDLGVAASLAARLVRQHHDADPGRFFLPDNVEQGYTYWFGRELGRQEAVVLVALSGEALVGYCYGTLEGRNWNLLLDQHGAIHDLYVHEEMRRRGTGRRLLEAMLKELQALGARRVVLSTMVNNTVAQKLFEQVGFRPTMLEMTCGG